MSGFVGWMDFRRDLGAQEDVLHAMADTMQHRGPDAKGLWLSRHAALGHRRLAVGDTAGGAAGGDAQPLTAEIGGETVAVVHAGEIYNAADLGGGSSEEVLLRSYLRWGDRLAERLDGMGAFAVWDGRSRRLLLGRDRMGLKPLYYFAYPGGILFASEPKGIMANPLFEARLDPAALPIVLQPRLTLPGETPLAGLREVPPGHVVIWSEDGPSPRRYWRLSSEPHRHSFEETTRHVRELLEDAVGRQVPASGPCAAMLSGGVDSTSVAALAVRALAARDGRSLDTFCVRFESDSAHFSPTELRPEVDAPYAADAAEFMGSRHHTVTVGLRDLLDAVPATRRARDLPGWGQFDASMYLLFREMREIGPVAMSGEAADEIFGGYPYFFKPELVNRDGFPWMGDGPRLADYLSPEMREMADPVEDERARLSQLLSEVPRLPGEDPENARMREVLHLGMSGPLAVVLDRKERMSMASGLEVRIPFCDHRLIEYVWNVPWSMKSRGGLKGLLKAAMADVLPPGTLNRRKSAYPHVHNPEYDHALIEEATWIVSDERSPIGRMFDRPRLAEFIRGIAADRLRPDLPGGTSAPHMLIQLVEMRRWIEDYQVSLG
ncbi:asparagine synthase (glutamine-hydrolyzing) [Microbispora triticiradicis]|uniref:asparagine synthase (glutamine-hydrolyzing) n=2 Tax=Microbispora TaxID=2005 RepID=A0ABY3M4R5_9ACTN|nr:MULTISPECIES: asparagine synthase (glutamine-hydrolyzing) [Microbispora]TLP57073.1 asparagine synthase (glutamine-hydrolyzing) [Microbispora fusca]TYB67029.1 asparagine synthase (glutamine-hydrolyzing) [Microbispora tritici]